VSFARTFIQFKAVLYNVENDSLLAVGEILSIVKFIIVGVPTTLFVVLVGVTTKTCAQLVDIGVPKVYEAQSNVALNITQATADTVGITFTL